MHITKTKFLIYLFYVFHAIATHTNRRDEPLARGLELSQPSYRILIRDDPDLSFHQNHSPSSAQLESRMVLRRSPPSDTPSHRALLSRAGVTQRLEMISSQLSSLREESHDLQKIIDKRGPSSVDTHWINLYEARKKNRENDPGVRWVERELEPDIANLKAAWRRDEAERLQKALKGWIAAEEEVDRKWEIVYSQRKGWVAKTHKAKHFDWVFREGQMLGIPMPSVGGSLTGHRTETTSGQGSGTAPGRGSSAAPGRLTGQGRGGRRRGRGGRVSRE